MRVRRDPGVALWVAAGVCWAATFWLVLGSGGPGHHAAVGGQPAWPWPLRLGAPLGAWLVMVGAMMLPTAVPMVRMFAVVSARAPGPAVARLVFLAGYLAVWTAFAVVALLADRAVHALVASWAWLAVRPGLLLGAVLLVAGAFQFSALKDACLTACRNPVEFLFRHYRRGGAWGSGLRHGVSCLGCCWALMLVMIGAGIASLAWMLGLTAVMVVEKTAPRGDRLVAPVGVLLLVAGVSLTLSALLS
ncbi:MAG TPA: DUF2182 domain-containing protein [Pseudonocardia sp.]|uniref:DUF2182 domain-containing protein n=1 Tax=Pseudonocardia sp. TaxID=60912 RepID=UPI002B4B6FDC|nr:DUF2182 domain-containing protein [Pseudonocardia sp.]HLU56642.1 DUF2182 domain-containing protein [Pseudonocardia sp.]